jgi:hypothetical protein
VKKHAFKDSVVSSDCNRLVLVDDYSSSGHPIAINEHILKFESENLPHIDDCAARNSGVFEVCAVAGQPAARSTVNGE